MTSFPRSPQILKSGIVLLDTASFQPKRVVVLQYNPDQLSRTLQVQAMSGESGDRSEALRLKGAPVETFKLEAEIDATDELEQPDSNSATVTAFPISFASEDVPVVVKYGIFPQLAALESLISPTSEQLAEASLSSHVLDGQAALSDRGRR